MNQKKLIKTILILCILIFILSIQSTLISGLETKFLTYKNETLSITPQLEIIPCEVPVTSVFKIQRENYTSQSEPLQIEYIQQLGAESTNIKKEINKYTTSQTGNIYVNQSGNFSLQVIFAQEEKIQIYEWILQSSCQANINNLNNRSNNTNSSNNLNNTLNNSLNNTNLNNTSNNTNLNNTESDKIICFQNYGVKTNKDIFLNQDQIQIDFFVEPSPSNFSVSYWIEDLYGEIIKPVRTSKNLNTKTYTFSQIEGDEKSYVVKGIISDDCQDQEVKKLVVEKNERSEVERKSSIHILKVDEEIKNNIHFVKVELESYKGDTSKTVIELYVKSIQTNNKISPVQKIKIPQKYSSIIQTIYLPLFKEEDQIKIIATGIDANESQIISLKEKIKETITENKDVNEEMKSEKTGQNMQKAKIISAYTKHKKEQEEIKWYVSIQKNEDELQEGKIQIYYNNESQYKIINTTNNKGKDDTNDNTRENFIFILKNIHDKDEILTTIQINNTLEDNTISKIKLEPKEETKENNMTTIMNLKNINFNSEEGKEQTKEKIEEPNKKEIILLDQTKKIEGETIEIISTIIGISIISILLWKRKEAIRRLKKVFRGLEKQL